MGKVIGKCYDSSTKAVSFLDVTCLQSALSFCPSSCCKLFRKQGFDKVLHGRTIDQITEKSNCFIVLSEIANLFSFFEITMIF